MIDTHTTPQATTPTAVAYHWVMTVQTDDGRTATYDGPIDVVPGIHTHTSTYRTVREQVQAVVGTPHMVVLFFDLQPNQL